MKRVFNLFWFIPFILLISCKETKFRDKDAMISFIQNEKNGFIVKKTINGVEFSVLLKPSDLFVNQELREGYSLQEVNRLRRKYEDHLYFVLSISRDNRELLNELAGDQKVFGATVHTLAFDMKQKVSLIVGKNTVQPIDAVFSRMYGMSPSTDLLFSFPKKEVLNKTDSFRFILKDVGLGFGEISFKFSNKNLEEQPGLNFSNSKKF